ncbi:GNAT family N-acetyltransferase [Auraticoccus monumenti]|uniref:Ribosomal protein S18 acetylase RimI n=1 Tax=Auraticoccus monumenti TaxID=675864 RepID=A0A1G6X358_9ACTN|nr:GNAT family N-acetyltransferase [Auraticoccus monumenti]SDD72494.1 Ribosomal protein S18 acetylase RimI [Auraticoccus monumenti]
MAQTTLLADLSHDPITLTTRLAPSALPIGVQLRPTGPGDAEAVARLRLEAHPGRAGSDPATAAAEVGRHLAGEHGRLVPDGCLVAVDEQGQVIAWVLTVHPAPGAAGTSAPLVLDLCTAPPWQGRGLGRALVVSAMRAAAAEADQVQILVEDSNASARSLFHSLGFAPAGSAS